MSKLAYRILSASNDYQQYQVFMLLIHFDKPLCPRHHRPLQYLCMSQPCPCALRLCSTCTHEHSRKYNKSDFMKDGNFYKKLQMEGDIIKKQYSFIDKHLAKQPVTTLLNSKNEESIKIVEFIMRVTNEDKRSVFKTVDDFMASHAEVKKKLATIKPKNSGKYMSSMDSSLVTMMLNLLSEKGLERLKTKVVECQSGSKRYCEFLAATQKYGDSPQSFLVGLGFKTPLLRQTLKPIINWEKRSPKAVPPSDREQKQAKKASGKQQGNKSEQLFVPLPTPAKKIRLLTPVRRPKTASNGKEN